MRVFAAAAADPLSAILGVAGGLISGAVAWWKASRTSKQRVDDAAWERARAIYDTLMRDYERRLAEQDTDLEAARKRIGVTERDLGLANRRVDRLVSLMTRAGVEVPAELMTRPWDNGTDNGGQAPTVKG